MKIGVIADTHSLEIPLQVLEAFRGVDFIVHAGDFCRKQDLKVLSAIAEVKAVRGNRDDEEIRAMFPEKLFFTAGKFRIGVCHGVGCGDAVWECIQGVFAKDPVDVVIFGHSHQPLKKTLGGVLYFNPGSPTDKVSAPYCSFGMIQVSVNRLTAQIVKII